jgi:hypothetical protein
MPWTIFLLAESTAILPVGHFAIQRINQNVDEYINNIQQNNPIRLMTLATWRENADRPIEDGAWFQQVLDNVHVDIDAFADIHNWPLAVEGFERYGHMGWVNVPGGQIEDALRAAFDSLTRQLGESDAADDLDAAFIENIVYVCMCLMTICTLRVAGKTTTNPS